MHDDSKLIRKNFANLSSSILNLGQTFHELYVNFNEFDSVISIGKESNNHLKGSYISFNNTLMEWGKSFDKISNAIAEKMIHHFKYSLAEIKVNKEFLKRAND